MKTYFKGLNGLRFIGAFSVIIGHIELIKSFYGLPNLMDHPFYRFTNGHLGVLLFFVLSGFLITYFLIVELQENNHIDFKIFYIKRILRIWPIYYIMILFSIFILPKLLTFIGVLSPSYSFETIKYYLLFLPNFAKSFHYSIPGAVHLWSVGVEEQFYLIWPILIILFKNRLLILFTTIFLIFSLVPMVVDFLYIRSDLLQQFKEEKLFISSFLSSFKINSMALGGCFAYIYIKHKKLLNFLNYRIVELSLIIFTSSLWIMGFHFKIFSDEIYSLLFALIIFSVVTNNNPIIKFENRLFNFLGKISYGLYVYHWVILILIIQLIKLLGVNFYESHILVNSLIYFLGITLTVFISYISYKYIEEPIVNLKNKFQKN